MNIRLEIKPMKVTESTYDRIIFNIRRWGFWNWSDGVMVDRQRENVVLYNLQKINRKVKHIKYKSGPNKGKVKETITVRKGEWKANIYTIPVSVLAMMGATAKQHTRHFTITKKKKQ